MYGVGSTSNFTIEPFFFEGTLNGERYLNLLQNHVIPFLKNKRCLSSTIFQQDGAPPHIENNVKKYLNDKFPGGRVISRHFPFTWPPRSPDLNPMDYFFWGYLKYKVYQHKISTLENLREIIRSEIKLLPREMLQAAIEDIWKRLDAVVENDGGHIEY